MAWMNFWCGIYYAAYLFVATNIGQNLVAFCLAPGHGDVALDLLLFCLCGAVGQVPLCSPRASDVAPVT